MKCYIPKWLMLNDNPFNETVTTLHDFIEMLNNSNQSTLDELCQLNLLELGETTNVDETIVLRTG